MNKIISSNCISIFLLAVIASSGVFSSCSSQSTTTTRNIETVEDPGHDDYDQTRVVKHESTIEHTEAEPEKHSGLFSILGDIIAWPFRVIGSAF